MTREDDCQLIKVDKQDYTRIMKVRPGRQMALVCAHPRLTPLGPSLAQNIEHNTVRLEEHGAPVMVLEKKTSESKSQGWVRAQCHPGRPTARALIGMAAA